MEPKTIKCVVLITHSLLTGYLLSNFHHCIVTSFRTFLCHLNASQYSCNNNLQWLCVDKKHLLSELKAYPCRGVSTSNYLIHRQQLVDCFIFEPLP